jgi:transposase
MDNAKFHKRKDIIQVIEDAGHILEFLPPYSPDLNKIEPKWNQGKSIRRKHQCSTYDLFSLHHF